ncbi:MAG: N-acetyltransferase [Promethearchaeota archaeon]|nr:MAG: N-acetyltransferase [Candidatus Lokiarchaeota archaeon]
MANRLNNLFRFNQANINLAGKVCTKAYFEDPLFCWFFPELSKRSKYLSVLFNVGFRYCQNYGEVYATSSNIEGVASWLPYNKSKISFAQMIRFGFLPLILKAGIKNLKKMNLYDKFCQKMHKEHANFSHYYLYNIAVDPEYQGKGYASKLIRPMLARFDEQNLPCYLETQIEKNVSIYQHFDFDVLEKALIPEANLNSWSMLRKIKK